MDNDEASDSPPAYSAVSIDEITTEIPCVRQRKKETDRSGIFKHQANVDPPIRLVIAKKSMVSKMSVLYTILIVVFCVVFITTEILVDIPLNILQSKGFYTYLYTGSIGFMLYIFFCMMKAKCVDKSEDDHQATVKRFIKELADTTGIRLKESSNNAEDESNVTRWTVVDSVNETAEESVTTNTQPEVVVKLMFSENDKSHGSLMLRLGAITFGIGTLLYTGLEFIHFFEVPNNCISWHILSGVNPLLQMIFTFMQMYFLFVHSRLNINKNQFIAKFGLMHLIATNCCIWIRTLAKESLREMVEHEQFHNPITSDIVERIEGKRINDSTPELKECRKVEILGDAIQNSAVYLFPFIIEFSIIGVHILHNMWANVGNRSKLTMSGEASEQTETCRKRLEWSGSDVGLFTGLLVLVTHMITMLLYFSLINQPNYRYMAVLIMNITDTTINALMSLAILIGFIRVKNMKIIQDQEDQDILLTLSASGLFIYSTFTIFSGYLNEETFLPTALVILNGLSDLLQVFLQLLFISDLKQKMITKEHGKSRPGRQIVTFLIFTNLGLWITYNFEMQKANATPDQLNVYGFFPWIVIQRITLPLSVFFRFHSTVVFTELWKKCYIIKNKDMNIIS